MATPLMVPDTDIVTDVLTDETRPWKLLLHNDPVNLAGYVTMALQEVFGFSKEKSARLMKEAHEAGKAVVSSGTKEKVEAEASQLQARSLWTSIEQDS